MTILQALILGFVQGITEFLPISSSGHLVLVPALFGWQIPQEQIFPFDVLVQLGTLVAVIIYFWKDLWLIITAVISGLLHKKPFETQQAKLGWFIVLATIPAVIAGVLIKDIVESAFNSTLATALFLFLTAAILYLSEIKGHQQKTNEDMTWKNAIMIGFFQVLAIFPGVSRSGSTIGGSIFLNFKRKEAARFSFLMSIPVMIGAGVFSFPDLLRIPDLNSFLPSMIIGFLAAMIVGYASIHWLLKFLTRHSLRGFAFYCVAAGFLGLMITFF
jgi:undecaprenyl-diphosphatase